MAITEMSPGHQYAVTSLFKRFQNKQRVDPARTHDAHGSYVGWILQPGYTGQIGSGIGTPVTQKSDYFWFKFPHNFHPSLTLAYYTNCKLLPNPYNALKLLKFKVS
jgi:hypothetical protein